MPRRFPAAALAVLAAVALAGCSGSSTPHPVCVPELTVTPADPLPGRVVTVSPSRACPVDLPDGERWTVRIQPEDRRIPLAQASVVPDADGSFQVSITVPPTMPAGRATVWITNYWDFTRCPEGASCAAAAGSFDVAAASG